MFESDQFASIFPLVAGVWGESHSFNGCDACGEVPDFEVGQAEFEADWLRAGAAAFCGEIAEGFHCLAEGRVRGW